MESFTGGRILFIDAYDSFSENIVAMLRETLNVDVTSLKIDSVVPEDLDPSGNQTQYARFAEYLQNFDAVIVGPGPGNPANPKDIGIISQIWNLPDSHLLPVLGICLGFQSLCLTFGGSVERLPLPCHGHVQAIRHIGTDLFQQVGHLEATNYHSLHVILRGKEASLQEHRSRCVQLRSTSPEDDSGYDSRSTSSRASSLERRVLTSDSALQELAWTENNILMSARHVNKPFWGVQFHPESCKSSSACHQIIRNWWYQSHIWNLGKRRSVKTDYLFFTGPHSKNTTQDDPTYGNVELPETLDSCIWTTFENLTVSCTPRVTSMPIPYDFHLSTRILDMVEKVSYPGMKAVLESTRKGRYSIFALPSPTSWRLDYWSDSQTLGIETSTKGSVPQKVKLCKEADVFQYISAMTCAKMVGSSTEESPFWGGFIGFLSYEMGLEKFGDAVVAPREVKGMPADLSFLWVERCVIIDHHEQKSWAQTILCDDDEWLHQTLNSLTVPASDISYETAKHLGVQSHCGDIDRDLNKSLLNATVLPPDIEQYKDSIRQCQQYLRSGDSYELCLTAETQIALPKSGKSIISKSSHALALYLRLRKLNPVPFASYLDLGDTRIASASPEQFMTWSRGGQIDMVPMKGTVKKSAGMTFERASQILASPKEQAENLMIADLIRHDLYSLFDGENKVDVVKLCDVIEHETVYQLVSHIRTAIPDQLTGNGRHRQTDILKHGQRALISTLPPGSMTGAPKKRSCEILSKLENRRRGVYSGAIGYIDLGGAGAFSVCIRTAFSHSGPEEEMEKWRIGAGGAITVLSDEHAEWEEMKTKLDSILKAFKPDV